MISNSILALTCFCLKELLQSPKLHTKKKGEKEITVYDRITIKE